MDNVTINACEKEDQWSTERKMLVEHGESDNIYFNSVTSASVVEKQLAEGLAVFRSMGAKCVEKTHRSNSVLMNVLRERPVAASVLHQAVTSRADVVCLKSMRNDETTWKLLKAVHGTQVVRVHWQKLAQRVLQYIALDRVDEVFGTMCCETSGTIHYWSSSDWDQSPISRQPIKVGLLHGR